MSGNGWCTHPDRQVSSDVRILVRKAELACRNAWGSDLWESADANDVPAAKPVVPADIQLPARPVAIAYDDEVTSVVTAGEHKASSSLDDEVVEQSTISFVDDYDHDQDERRDLLYRNSRSAIERARERARERQVPREATRAVSSDDVLISEGEGRTDASAASLETPTFEPDDFVEEETPAARADIDEHDDALISEGIQTPTPRSRRLRRFRDEAHGPKEVIAAKSEPEPDEVEHELPPSAAPERGRFDSIPEISADIDLPLLRRSSSANAPDPETQRDAAPESSSYERALKRAHAVNQATRAEHNQQRRRESTPIAMADDPRHASMPDIPEEPARRMATPQMMDSLSIPTGTSAVLHPRVAPERTRASRPIAPAHAEQPSRMRVEQPQRRSPDARQSWWRGGWKNAEGRASDQASHDEPELVVEPQHEMTTIELGAAIPATNVAEMPAPIEHQDFDLRDDSDLESFRTRLFASDEGTEGAHRDEPSRGPISIARRERRPIAPAPRKRRPEVRATVEPEAEPTVERHHEPEHRTLPRVTASPRPAPQEMAYEPDVLVRARRDVWRDPEPEPLPQFDVRDLIRDDTGLLDMTIEIAPEVPRACVTCRNYRPSEQPGRGWCTNTWAFTHRQMVNEDDIACDSTIGCWWLPADEEVWLDEFEVAADATPRVDRLLARMDPERQAVGN